MQIAIGQIARAHGIRGEVTVLVRTDEPDVRFAPGTALATEPPERGPLTVAATRWHSGRLLVMFEGVRDRNDAEDLKGTLLVLDSAQIPASDDPDEFYDHQLIGLAVVTTAGVPVGEVTDVLHHGQDLLVVRRAPGPDGTSGSSRAPGSVRAPGSAGETLVPFVSAIVTEVDVPAGRLVIDPPPGLLDAAEAVEA